MLLAGWVIVKLQIQNLKLQINSKYQIQNESGHHLLLVLNFEFEIYL